MAESDVGNGAGTTHDTNAALSAASEGSNTVDDVAAIGDLDDMGPKGVSTVTSNDNRGFGFVFGSGRSASRATSDFSVGISTAVGGRVVGVMVVVAITLETAGGGAMFLFGIVVVVVVVVMVKRSLEMEISGVEGRRKGVSIHGV